MRELTAAVVPDEIVWSVRRTELSPVFEYAGVSPSWMANVIARQMEKRFVCGGRDRKGVLETLALFNPGRADGVRLADAPERAKRERCQDKNQPANQTQELPLRATERG